MTYKPTSNKEEVEALVQQRIEEILSKIDRVTTMYVEPGDTVVVHLKEGTTESQVEALHAQMQYLFADNKGLIDGDNIIVKIEVLGKIP